MLSTVAGLLSAVLLHAQRGPGAAEVDSLKNLFEDLYQLESDQAKKSLNRDILAYFSQVLEERESFRYSFDSLDMIGVLTAPDRTFRIFTWNVPMTDFTHEYYGLIQRPEKKEKRCRIYRLSKGVSLNEQILHDSCTAGQWPGALYYEILKNTSGGEDFYTLLGFYFNDRFSDMKVIEAMYFDDSGDVIFGKPVFHTGQGTQHRVLFEYSGEVVFNLRYNPDLKMIVFDHLSPIEPELAGHPRFYAPDFSYDGYRYGKGFWEYLPDIDVRNR